LQRADLSEVDLYDADLSHTNLKEANFERSRLGQSYLIGADVSNANFERADLRHVNLDGIQNYKQIASLYKANVYGIESPPEGFSEWTIDEMEAVSISDDNEWRTARLS